MTPFWCLCFVAWIVVVCCLVLLVYCVVVGWLVAGLCVGLLLYLQFSLFLCLICLCFGIGGHSYACVLLASVVIYVFG